MPTEPFLLDMKNSFLPLLAILLLSFGVKSQTYNYAPNAINNPFLSQKGNTCLSIGRGRGLSFESLEIQAVYSPLRNLALMVNYFGALEKKVRNRTEIGTNAYLMEAAIGLYEPIRKGSASLFAGFGAGDIYSHFGGNNVGEFNIQRLFLQPGITYRSRLFQAGVSMRITRLRYSKGNISYSIDQSHLTQIKNIENQSPLFLPELGIQAGMRIKPVTLNLSFTVVFPNTERYNFNGLNTALSLQVDFGGKEKS